MENLDFDLIRSEVVVARKEDYPGDCPSTSESTLSPEIKHLLLQLPVFNLSQRGWGNDDEEAFSLFDDIFDGDQQFYVLIWKGRKFFVDTQGYTYGRYCGELIP